VRARRGTERTSASDAHRHVPIVDISFSIFCRYSYRLALDTTHPSSSDTCNLQDITLPPRGIRTLPFSSHSDFPLCTYSLYISHHRHPGARQISCLMRTFRSPAALLSNSGFDANVSLFACVLSGMPCSTEGSPTPPFTTSPRVYCILWHESPHRPVARYRKQAALQYVARTFGHQRNMQQDHMSLMAAGGSAHGSGWRTESSPSRTRLTRRLRLQVVRVFLHASMCFSMN
jgi:hypothetical protein